MKKILVLICVTILFFASINLFNAQNTTFSEIKYGEIENKIEEFHNEPKKLWSYINLYIKKSKSENNFETLVYAYRYATNFSDYPLNIKYADSAIAVSMKSNNNDLLTNAYLNRGVAYMDEEFYEKALNDILIANKLSVSLNNEYINNKTKYFIAQNKIYLGQYEEANAELKSCIIYFRKNRNSNDLGKANQKLYIYSLMSLIDSNSRIGKQSNNEALLHEAYDYINQNNLKNFIPYFVSSEGISAFYSGNYSAAIFKLSEAIRLYNDPWKHITEIYYIGLSNWKLNKHSVSVKYLEEIDREYNTTKKLDPQFRPAYELLIKYNDSIGNRVKQLEYINKLMFLDNNYEKNYKYLYSKINKEYDSQKLLLEKNKVEKSLKIQRTIISSILLLSLFAAFFYAYRYNRLQKKYKEKFDKIIGSKQEPKTTEAEIKINEDKISITTPQNSQELVFYDKIPGINPLYVEKVLNQLNDFEEEQGFTDNQLSIRALSEEFEINPTYLSKIINVYKGKSFSSYISDLRLDYILSLLKTDAKYLSYDVKDLAYMAGFTNAKSFSDNFQRRFEIKPSIFIKMMIENVKANSLST